MESREYHPDGPGEQEWRIESFRKIAFGEQQH